MGGAVPAILAKLAQHGVSVKWRDGKVVVKAAAAPPADIVALIDAHKAEISSFLRPEAVQRRLDAEAEVLRAPRPPDVSDAAWKVATDGLRAFIADGYGAEAERHGWSRAELYNTPKLWSQVSLYGAALLVAGREIVSITPTEIRFKTSGDSTQAYYRKAPLDYGLVFRERLKRFGLDAGQEECRLRAIEFAVDFCRANTGLDLESAKKLVLSAISKEQGK